MDHVLEISEGDARSARTSAIDVAVHAPQAGELREPAEDGGYRRQAPPIVPDPIAPDVLADLMIASALSSSADVVSLHAKADACSVLLSAGGRTIGRLEVPADVGIAVTARLALIAGLTPPVPPGTEGGGVARIEARAGGQTGDLVISMEATKRGLDVEIHPLFPHARAASRRVSLKRCTRCGGFQPPQRATCDQDGAPLVEVEDDPTVGGTIATYRVTGILGQGSMGTVFGAEHALIKKLVAVKVLHPSLAGDVAVVRRFLREARAASRLRHPNALEVTDFGLLGDARPFMVMERLSGHTLEARLERHRALRVRTALLLAREIALALEAAHAAGVVHNDLKPANVVLLEGSTDESPRLKLVDFGAASVVGEGTDADDLMIGTPHYMAPERVLGQRPDERSDVYALGIMMFEMLSGQVPYQGATTGAVVLAQVRHTLPPLLSPFGLLPTRVCRLVARALAKSPAERHGTMHDLLCDINAALAVASRRGWRWLWP